MNRPHRRRRPAQAQSEQERSSTSTSGSGRPTQGRSRNRTGSPNRSSSRGGRPPEFSRRRAAPQSAPERPLNVKRRKNPNPGPDLTMAALPWALLGWKLGWMPRALDRVWFALLWPLYRMVRSGEIRRVQSHLLEARIQPCPPVRHIYRNLFLNSLDSLRLLQRRSGGEKLFQTSNRHVLQSAIQTGKPVVVVSIHTGAFEATHRLLTRFGRQVHVLTAPLSPPGLNVAVARLRATSGLILHDAEQAPMVLRSVIRNNGVLALMVDQARSGSGVRTHFLGRPTQLFFRLVEEASQLGALVVTCRCIQRGGSHTLRFEHCYEPQRSPRELEIALVGEMERWVREHPEQWVWHYARHWQEGDTPTRMPLRDVNS